MNLQTRLPIQGHPFGKTLNVSEHFYTSIYMAYRKVRECFP